MFAKLKSLLSEASQNTKKTDHKNESHQADLAAIALLIAVSNADHQVDQSEVDRILQLAKESIEVSEEEIRTYFNQAERKADASISYYEFTEVINRSYDKNKRYQLIQNMWKVAYADGVLDKYEDSTIRKVSELLYVSHSDFIKAKHSAAEDKA